MGAKRVSQLQNLSTVIVSNCLYRLKSAMASVELDQTHLKSTTSTKLVTIIIKAPITSDSWLAPSPELTSLAICPGNNLPPLKGATASFHKSTVSINRLFRHRVNQTISSHNFGRNREVVGNPRVPAHSELWFLPECGETYARVHMRNWQQFPCTKQQLIHWINTLPSWTKWR